MTGSDTSSFAGGDWGWVRLARLRWDLVNALELAAQHPENVPTVGCDGPECCLAIRQLLPSVGLQTSTYDGRMEDITFPESLQESVTAAMRDCLFLLSIFFKWQLFAKANPFDGMMEVPEAVGDILWSPHFAALAQPSSVAGHDPDVDLIREFVYALTEVALPDPYLQRVFSSNGNFPAG